MINISLVVPVYCGAQYLPELAKQVSALRADLEKAKAPFSVHELIFVNDNAIDNSDSVMMELDAKYDFVKNIFFSRNFGQHPATIAGIRESVGDWVVTLDEDLQHPPAYIPQMLEKAASESLDVVYIQPESGVHESIFRDLSSRTYKRLIEIISGNKSIRMANSFRLMRGDVARAAANACGHNSYFDVVLSWYTQRFAALKMELKDHRYIEDASSGYSLKSLLSHAHRMAFSGQIKLLRFATVLGLFTVGLSTFVVLAIVVLKLFGSGVAIPPGWTSQFLATTVFSGIILFLLGIVLEYLSLLIIKSHGQPLYSTTNRESDLILRDYFKGD